MKKTLTILLIIISTGLFAQQNAFSLEFDGQNDFVSLGSSSDLNPPNFSIITHLKLTDAPSVYHTIISRWDFPNYSYILYSQPSLRKMGFNIFSGGAEKGFTGNTIVTDTTWHHVVATFDGDTAKLYIDGILDATSVLGPIDLENEVTYLGRNNDGPQGRTLDGSIAYIGMFDYELDSAEISKFKDCPPEGTEPGLVGFWNLEEGSGTGVSDETLNGNNGSLGNGTTWTTDVPILNCETTHIENVYLGKIEISPNPFQNYLGIESEANLLGTVSITNLLGHEIITKEINGNNCMILTHELKTKGIYFINIINNDGVRIVSKKLIHY